MHMQQHMASQHSTAHEPHSHMFKRNEMANYTYMHEHDQLGLTFSLMLDATLESRVRVWE